MLNLPIKILKTVELETQNIEITIDDIDLMVDAVDTYRAHLGAIYQDSVIVWRLLR